MSKNILLALLLFAIPVAADASFLTDNWLSREYRQFREYPRLDKAYKLMKVQEYEEAVLLLKKVLEINPKQEKAYIALIEACLRLDDFTCVTAAAKAWKKNDPTEQRAAYYLSFAYHQLNLPELAVANALEIVTADPVTLEPEYLRVLLDILISDLIEERRGEEAVHWLIEYCGAHHLINLNRALDWSRQLVNHGFYAEGNQLLLHLPQRTSVVRARIVLLAKWGKPEEAAVLLESSFDPILRKKAQYWLYLSGLYAKSGNICEELKALYKGIGEADDKQPLYYALLNRLIGLERLDDSAVLLESMLQKQDDPELRSRLVGLLAESRNYDEAIEQVKIILQDTSLGQDQVLEFREKLGYFLDQSNRREELAELLGQNYQETGEYRYLLQAEDTYRLLAEDVKRLQLLEETFPFQNVPPSHRDYLVLELIKLYLAADEIEKGKDVVIYLARQDQLDAELADRLLVILQQIKRPDLVRRLAEYMIHQQTATGYTYLAAGYCMQELNKPGLALDYMMEAEKRETSKEEHRTLLKAMGYLAAEQYRTQEALSYWRQYLTEQFDVEIALRMVLLALTNNYPEQAEPFLSELENHGLTPEEMAQYVFAIALVSEADGRLEKARVLYEMSLLLDSNDEVRHKLSTAARKAGDLEETLAQLNILLTNQPENSLLYAERGYLHGALKNDEEAVVDFKSSLALIPDRMTLSPEIAYALLRLGERKEALGWFYRSVDEAPFFPPGEDPGMEEERSFKLRSSLQSIEDQWEVMLASVLRLDEYEQPAELNSPVAFASYDGFYSAEVSYRFDEFPGGKQNGRIKLYGRGLIGMENQSLDVKSESLLLGLGVKYKLMQTQNLYVSAERVFGVGDEVSDDWMFRFQGGYSIGEGFKPSLAGWFYLRSYGDVSYLLDKDIYYSIIDADMGYQFKLPGGASPGATIYPYLTSQYTNNNSNGEQKVVDRFDIGAGIGLFSWHMEGEYRAFGLRSELSLEGRVKVAGNMDDESTIRLQWEVFF